MLCTPYTNGSLARKWTQSNGDIFYICCACLFYFSVLIESGLKLFWHIGAEPSPGYKRILYSSWRYFFHCFCSAADRLVPPQGARRSLFFLAGMLLPSIFHGFVGLGFSFSTAICGLVFKARLASHGFQPQTGAWSPFVVAWPAPFQLPRSTSRLPPLQYRTRPARPRRLCDLAASPHAMASVFLSGARLQSRGQWRLEEALAFWDTLQTLYGRDPAAA